MSGAVSWEPISELVVVPPSDFGSQHEQVGNSLEYNTSKVGLAARGWHSSIFKFFFGCVQGCG
jgi:hypothetical protein